MGVFDDAPEQDVFSSAPEPSTPTINRSSPARPVQPKVQVAATVSPVDSIIGKVQGTGYSGLSPEEKQIVDVNIPGSAAYDRLTRDPAFSGYNQQQLADVIHRQMDAQSNSTPSATSAFVSPGVPADMSLMDALTKPFHEVWDDPNTGTARKVFQSGWEAARVLPGALASGVEAGIEALPNYLPHDNMKDQPGISFNQAFASRRSDPVQDLVTDPLNWATLGLPATGLVAKALVPSKYLEAAANAGSDLTKLSDLDVWRRARTLNDLKADVAKTASDLAINDRQRPAFAEQRPAGAVQLPDMPAEQREACSMP